MTPPITVSEERLRQLFADFKLELFEMLAKKADADSFNLLATRVMHLELWQASMVATEGTKARLSARGFAVWTLVSTVFAGVVAAIATLVWLAIAH